MGTQPVTRCVGPFDAFGFGIKSHDWGHRRKCLFVHAPRLAPHALDDRRLEKVSFAAADLAASAADCSAVAHGVFDLSQSRFERLGADQWAYLNTGLKPIPNPQFLNRGDKPVHELRVDTFLYED